MGREVDQLFVLHQFHRCSTGFSSGAYGGNCAGLTLRGQTDIKTDIKGSLLLCRDPQKLALGMPMIDAYGNVQLATDGAADGSRGGLSKPSSILLIDFPGEISLCRSYSPV